MSDSSLCYSLSLEGEGARQIIWGAGEGLLNWLGLTLIRGFAPPSPLREKKVALPAELTA